MLKNWLFLFLFWGCFNSTAFASGGGGTIITGPKENVQIFIMREHGSRIYIPEGGFVLLSSMPEGSYLSLQTTRLGQQIGHVLEIRNCRIALALDDGSVVYVIPAWNVR
jgi:hypothetical protein